MKPRHPFLQYFADIWAGVSTTWIGMRLTFGYMFKPTVTLRYPEVKPRIPESHRGLHAYEEAKCIACRMCERACPVECITIEMVGRGKDALITRYDVDYSRCLFCNLCAEVCPTDCVWLSKRYSLACGERSQCILRLATRKSDEAIAQYTMRMAEKEAERKAQQAQKEAAAATEAAKAQPSDRRDEEKGV